MSDLEGAAIGIVIGIALFVLCAIIASATT